MTRRHEFIDGVFPIQIRPDLVVRLYPIPHDLTVAEAEKIARVIRALARDSGSGPQGENSRSEVEGEAPQSGLSDSEGIALPTQDPNP